MNEPIFIHPAEARRQFAEFADGEITNENIARGALLIALEDYPQLDVDEYLGKLDALADRVASRTSPGEPTVFRLGHLQAEMFDVDGYRGDDDNYYDPRNAYLNEVIDRKRGLPITLSIIFLHVAARAGLTAYGVGLPGHYVVKVQFELNEIFVDPFHRGETLTLGDLTQIVTTAAGREVRLSGDHLRAWSGRETLLRVLSNLHSMWGRAGETKKADAALERMLLLQATR